jgi:hypothetical protein
VYVGKVSAIAQQIPSIHKVCSNSFTKYRAGHVKRLPCCTLLVMSLAMVDIGKCPEKRLGLRNVK